MSELNVCAPPGPHSQMVGGQRERCHSFLDPWETSPNAGASGTFLLQSLWLSFMPPTREGKVPPLGIHSASYLDRFRARDNDRGFVEDVDPHDGAILLSPGNQNDPKGGCQLRET